MVFKCKAKIRQVVCKSSFWKNNKLSPSNSCFSLVVTRILFLIYMGYTCSFVAVACSCSLLWLFIVAPIYTWDFGKIDLCSFNA